MEDIEQLLEASAPALRRGLRIDPLWQSALDVDDVLQVTWVDAFLAAEALRALPPDRQQAWLRRAAERNLQDALKGLQRDKRPDPRHRLGAQAGGDESRALLLEELLATSRTASRSAAGREEQALLRQAIDRLPASHRKVVDLYDLQGRPVADVAAAIGRSPGAVFMLRARAHDRLRELLGGAPDDA